MSDETYVGPWLLHAGQYDDREILGVIPRSTARAAIRTANRLTVERVHAERARDMCAVTAERIDAIDVAPEIEPGDTISGVEVMTLPVGSAVVFQRYSDGDDGHAIVRTASGWYTSASVPIPQTVTTYDPDPASSFRVLFVGRP